MVQFSQIRLNGFKSFADKAEVDIGNGLNGVVGPNGCGKSNLVEALRWVMGESSAKRMRGSGMEDVIFAGTSKRPAKNRAEVALVLDNPYRDAPAPFQNLNKIEVTRTIERDQGSTYRVNGKAVRARDVQMLFADTVSGANSPALVSQGRVTAMINAKPSERRQILEESAGVSGLYARRHEAELRLKAAENNLLRLDDIIGGLDTRIEALRKQARQANRYKNLSQTLRDLEALSLYLEWKASHEQITNLKSDFEELETVIRTYMQEVASISSQETNVNAELPKLRENDQKFAAQLQTLLIEKQRIEDSLKRIDNDMAAAKRTLDQAREDKAHEQETIESSLTGTKLREIELKELQSKSGDQELLEQKKTERNTILKKLQDKEAELEQIVQNKAQQEAEENSHRQRINDLSGKKLSLENALSQIKEKIQSAEGQDDVLEKAANIKSEIDELNTNKERLVKDRQFLHKQIEEHEKEVEQLQKQWHEDNTYKEKIYSEIKVLKDFLQTKNEDNHAAVLEQIKPKKGYEIALAKAMGDTLLAALEDPQANQYWIKYNPENLPELSANLEPLSSKVKAPEALSISLSQIGVVSEPYEIKDVLSYLKPGQMAVSVEGDVYRWDGYVITARSQSATAMHLERKNRLEGLDTEISVLEEKLTKLGSALEIETENHERSKEQNSFITSSIDETDQKIAACMNALQSIEKQAAEVEQQKILNEERSKQIKEDWAQISEDLKTAQIALEEFEARKTSGNSIDTGALRDEIGGYRKEMSEINRLCERLSYDIETRASRIEVLSQDISHSKERIESSKKRVEALDARQNEAQQTITTLEKQPETLSSKLGDILSKISALEEQRQETATALAIAEEQARDHVRALKDAEGKLSSTKEKRGALQAQISNKQELITACKERIQEQQFNSVTALKQTLSWPEDKPYPSIEEIKGKRKKLTRERDNMGAVNLMAAQEVEEAEKESSAILAEKEDLVEAINALRQAIQKLNREARARMKDAFEKVNEFYSMLFEKLFKGGKAHLELIESDDILDSGLEIFAQPPGKKLQHLGLLSGGEQTLASIALIFAMFMTNPSPICVLDEIDAPLDDANVDRVCNLLEEMVRTTNTRFMIITHHRMTMARMDRLYGVTMAERGISQLVSVDLQQSLFAEAAE